MNNQMDQIPEFSESPEQKRTTSGKFNLRKSLAWDNAFFTSEGVLNPEELAVVNGSYRKTEFPTLLGIQEEMRTSADSASTLDNDSWALENLEIDLFENVRASIQKSYGNSNKSSIMADCSRTRELEKLDVPHIGSSRKAEHSSQNMMKPLNSLKRPGVSKRQEDTSKVVSLCPQVAAIKNEHSKSLLRPPRITSKSSHLPTVPSKRASDSRNIQLKSNTAKALSGNATDRQSLASLKKPHMDTGTVIPRALSSPKSSGLSVGSMVHPPFSSSSHKNSNNCSFSSKGQSHTETTRRKHDSRISLTGSNSKAPLRASKSKIGIRNASHSIMRSSSVSPSSSIDSAVSESSSTSTVLRTSASKQGSDVGFSSSHPSFAAPSDVPQPSAMWKFSTGLAKNGNSAAPQRQHIPKTTSAINEVSQLSAGDHAGSDISNSVGFKCSKPSGLRMPSLKFGYFDAEKTLVENSRKHCHTGMGISLSKISGVSNISGVNKPRSGKLHSIGPGAEDATSNCNSPQTQLTNFPSGHCIKAASDTSPYLPDPAEVQATSGKTVEKHNSYSKANKDSFPMTGEGNYLKDYNEAVDKVECGNIFNLSAEENANHTNLKSVISDLKSTDGSSLFSESSISKSMIKQAFYKVGEEGKGHLESDMHSVANPVSLEKENLIPEDQTAGLSKHLMSEKMELEIVEFLGKKVSSLCLNGTKDLNIDEDLELSTCLADTLTQKKFTMLPNPSPLS